MDGELVSLLSIILTHSTDIPHKTISRLLVETRREDGVLSSVHVKVGSGEVADCLLDDDGRH